MSLAPNSSTKPCRALAGLLATLTLVFAAVLWWGEQNWHAPSGVANALAAEPRQGESAGADSKNDAVLPGKPQPAGSTNDQTPQIEYFPQPSKIETKILQALDKPTTVDFMGTDFASCLTYLKDYHKFNLLIDWRAMKNEGVAFDQPITLKVAGVTLRSILKLLLEPVQLTYFIEDDMLQITTARSYSERLMTRIYPVRDLYSVQSVEQDTPRPEVGATPRAVSARTGDLDTAIVKTIDPDSWDDNHGPASMTYVGRARSLVIRQTSAMHEKILQLLRNLRAANRGEQHVTSQQDPPRITWQLHGPQRPDTYTLVGLVDLDGDGTSDREQLLKMIAASGGRIDNDIDEQGVLRVDGRIEDTPLVSAETRYIVIGKIPQPADLSDPDEVAKVLKIAGYYALLEDEARERGVRIIGLEEFIRDIGYEPMKKSDALR
ncbi:MAG TPA: hypothetical protein VGM05_07620 [Planctomycetaceae bacterium]|jgi:hypothetical protein